MKSLQVITVWVFFLIHYMCKKSIYSPNQSHVFMCEPLNAQNSAPGEDVPRLPSTVGVTGQQKARRTSPREGGGCGERSVSQRQGRRAGPREGRGR